MERGYLSPHHHEDWSGAFEVKTSGRCCARIRLLLDLTAKLNVAFLRAQDLDEILQAVLVGVTAGQGLGFNRAFLINLNTEKQQLEGRLALGPASREDANRIWTEMSQKQLSLFEILDDVRGMFINGTQPLNQLVKQIRVPLSTRDHVLVRSMTEKRAFWVRDGSGKDFEAPKDLRDILGTGEFAVAPLFTEGEAYGVIVADNYITGFNIDQEDVDTLQLFAGLASLAVGKTRMCEMLEQRIQALRSLNEEVERNKDLLVQAERYTSMGRMADQLLHEIRNPLSAIGGMARILERKLEDSELINYAETMIRQSERVEHTLDEIFDFVQVPELNPEHIELRDLVNASLVLFQSDFDRHDIKLDVDFQDLNPRLYIDHTHIKQAFLNILKNAVEAMPDGGLLTISVSIPNGAVEVKVSDTGIGMAKGYLVRADEPFFTTKSQGLGLGLCLAKRAVGLHGGSLYLTGNRAGGTTVTIILPVVSV